MNIQSQRIPAALQSVFLASNSGLDVHSPPPERVASKLFAIPQGRSHEPSCSHDRDAAMRASVNTDGMGKVGASVQPIICRNWLTNPLDLLFSFSFY